MIGVEANLDDLSDFSSREWKETTIERNNYHSLKRNIDLSKKHRHKGNGKESDRSKEKEIKFDSMPAKYCDPPNPCPLGHEKDAGCSTNIKDDEEFNRQWILDAQKKGLCPCDKEHMTKCPKGMPVVSAGDHYAHILGKNVCICTVIFLFNE